MTQEIATQHGMFFSTLAPAPAERRLVQATLLISLLTFLALLPFAKLPLLRVWAFIPIYESALLINDLITAVLLFGQYRILRSQALGVLGCGYLFTALMAAVHALTFPGLFAAGGLLGAGPQSTAWLYMFWHAGFPLFVVAYAWLKDAPPSVNDTRGRRLPLWLAVAVALGLVAAFTLAATAGQHALPKIMRGNHYTPAMIYVIGTVWAFSLVALILLWRCRVHSVLDLWLMVVVCAWLFDIGLAAMFNAGRFDLGFYAGRVYGLLAASFVLAMLLLENGRLYARLVEQHRQELQKNAELLALNDRITQSDLATRTEQAELTALAQRIAQGDLTVRIEPGRYRGDLGHALADMVASLRTMTHELGDGLSVLAQSAGTILSGSGEIAGSTAQTAAATVEAATTVTEVKQTAQVASDKARSVSDAAQQAAAVSQHGRTAVDDAIDGMQQIQDQMEQIAGSIVQLSEHTQRISRIIATVNDLADQSGLLAVNAAIEAAKAGDQGRGFAVVAQEVRMLAQQSKQATIEVRAILGDVCKAMESAVQNTQRGTLSVARGVAQSQAAGDAIRQLAESISASAQAAAQIAVAAQQQRAGMDQLAVAMENIRDAVTNNAVRTREAETAAQALHQLGVRLAQWVQRYRV